VLPRPDRAAQRKVRPMHNTTLALRAPTPLTRQAARRSIRPQIPTLTRPTRLYPPRARILRYSNSEGVRLLPVLFLKGSWPYEQYGICRLWTQAQSQPVWFRAHAWLDRNVAGGPRLAPPRLQTLAQVKRPRWPVRNLGESPASLPAWVGLSRTYSKHGTSSQIRSIVDFPD
jgi:hypothetical protein